ncbi:hypothetical protein C6P87_09360 [Burkholderia sp. AU12872]|nr:hypothetical protein EGY28_05210 [Burkholderia dolosa]PRE52428.1 hypothetical protein C6P87_09360 [Burkholderia sp. AU12872]
MRGSRRSVRRRKANECGTSSGCPWFLWVGTRRVRVGDLLRTVDVARGRRRRTRAERPARSSRFRLRRTFQRERGERIVGSQYACRKRNIGTM